MVSKKSSRLNNLLFVILIINFTNNYSSFETYKAPAFFENLEQEADASQLNISKQQSKEQFVKFCESILESESSEAELIKIFFATKQTGEKLIFENFGIALHCIDNQVERLKDKLSNKTINNVIKKLDSQNLKALDNFKQIINNSADKNQVDQENLKGLISKKNNAAYKVYKTFYESFQRLLKGLETEKTDKHSLLIDNWLKQIPHEFEPVFDCQNMLILKKVPIFQHLYKADKAILLQLIYGYLGLLKNENTDSYFAGSITSNKHNQNNPSINLVHRQAKKNSGSYLYHIKAGYNSYEERKVIIFRLIESQDFSNDLIYLFLKKYGIKEFLDIYKKDLTDILSILFKQFKIIGENVFYDAQYSNLIILMVEIAKKISYQEDGFGDIMFIESEHILKGNLKNESPAGLHIFKRSIDDNDNLTLILKNNERFIVPGLEANLSAEVSPYLGKKTSKKNNLLTETDGQDRPLYISCNLEKCEIVIDTDTIIYNPRNTALYGDLLLEKSIKINLKKDVSSKLLETKKIIFIKNIVDLLHENKLISHDITEKILSDFINLGNLDNNSNQSDFKVIDRKQKGLGSSFFSLRLLQEYDNDIFGLLYYLIKKCKPLALINGSYDEQTKSLLICKNGTEKNCRENNNCDVNKAKILYRIEDQSGVAHYIEIFLQKHYLDKSKYIIKTAFENIMVPDYSDIESFPIILKSKNNSKFNLKTKTILIKKELDKKIESFIKGQLKEELKEELDIKQIINQEDILLKQNLFNAICNKIYSEADFIYLYINSFNIKIFYENETSKENPNFTDVSFHIKIKREDFKKIFFDTISQDKQNNKKPIARYPQTKIMEANSNKND